jgi:hypothetical protein
MSYNGSGTFVINTAGQPVVSGTVISSTAFNALTADLATGLSTAITKDGQTTPTANIPMGNNKITGLAVGTAATDAANLSQVQSTVAKLVNSVSGADTITGTMSPNLAAYATGQMFYFIAAGDNTGAVTLNIDSLGAKAVTRDGSVALAAGDLKSGEVVVVVYDGTRFQVVSQINSAGNVTFANVSITSALNVGGVATVSGGATLNGGVVINEPGADADTRIEGDTDANLFFADASTDRVGLGTSSPGAKAEIYVNRTSSTNAVSLILNDNVTGAQTDGVYKAIRSLSNNGAAVSEIRFMETDGSNNNTSISFATQSTASALTERLRINQSGNLGLGVVPSAWDTATFKGLQIAGSNSAALVGRADNVSDMFLGNNVYFGSAAFRYIGTGTASYYRQDSGNHVWYTATSGTAGNALSGATAMILDTSGNLGVGTSSPSVNGIDIVKGSGVSTYVRTANGTYEVLSGFSTSLGGGLVGTISNHPLLLYANNAERARLTSGGDLLVGKTALNTATNGAQIESNGTASFARASNFVLNVNRNTSDGDVVTIQQDGTTEGSISVSGNTVSYNAFAGSHWSQLQDGSKPDILRGTVMESINELCEWPGEQNERLPKSKISDTAGSKKVYGVFMAWDNDWTETNDMYVTAVGAFICRVNSAVTVQEGDLLESNGDGTARVQADDIIRSSTIGKVTSTVKTHEYDDGSYCVPTVLYCG